MKIKGKELRQPTTLSLFLPRGDEDDDIIEIRAKAVLSYDRFDALLPVPKPPDKIQRGKGKQPDFQHPSYLAEMESYGKKKTAWLVIESLSATPDMTWEKVDPNDPNTWELYEQELRESGFSDIEKQRMLALVMDANCLNEARLEEARERFLSARQLEKGGSSNFQKDDQDNTSSGELANGSVSAHQD